MEENLKNFDADQKSLEELYKEISIIYKKIDAGKLCSSSEEFKTFVKKGLLLSKYLWNVVENLSLFSINENIEDVTTESLKFMTVPAMIGNFYYNDNFPITRLNTLNDAKKYYNVFLELMKNYNFKGANYDLGTVIESREEKINRFKEEKTCKERYLQLESYINQETVDDEIKREYYITSIKQWILKIRSDFKILNDEIYLVENKDTIKKEMPKEEITKSDFKPFIITSDMVKKSVFGAGYKSLPTYSLEEYYIKQVEMGHLPDPHVDVLPKGDGSTFRRIVPDVAAEEQKLAEQNDYLEDSHDIDDRLKKIRMDEYKDDNRRGCGSTQNYG